MNKNKPEFGIEPKTPTQRAETLLQKAEQQFDRLAASLPEEVVAQVDEVIIGFYLICGTDRNKPKAPILVDEHDLDAIISRHPNSDMQLVSFHKDASGTCDLLAQLDPIKADSYVDRLRRRDHSVSRSDVIISCSPEGPLICGAPVEEVEDMYDPNSGVESPLTRLEQVIRDVEEATIVRYPKPEPVSR